MYTCAFAILIGACFGALGKRIVERGRYDSPTVSHSTRANASRPSTEDYETPGQSLQAEIGPVLVNLSSKDEYLQAKVHVEIDTAALQKQLAEEKHRREPRGMVKDGWVFTRWRNQYVRQGTESKELSNFIALRKNRMQDVFISTLSSRNLEKIRSKDSLNKLRQELLAVFNDTFDVERPVITSVYFQHFQVF
jgi:flagellar basal body-associated protein FliL